MKTCFISKWKIIKWHIAQEVTGVLLSRKGQQIKVPADICQAGGHDKIFYSYKQGIILPIFSLNSVSYEGLIWNYASPMWEPHLPHSSKEINTPA